MIPVNDCVQGAGSLTEPEQPLNFLPGQIQSERPEINSAFFVARNDGDFGKPRPAAIGYHSIRWRFRWNPQLMPEFTEHNRGILLKG